MAAGVVAASALLVVWVDCLLIELISSSLLALGYDGAVLQAYHNFQSRGAWAACWLLLLLLQAVSRPSMCGGVACLIRSCCVDVQGRLYQVGESPEQSHSTYISLHRCPTWLPTIGSPSTAVSPSFTPCCCRSRCCCCCCAAAAGVRAREGSCSWRQQVSAWA